MNLTLRKVFLYIFASVGLVLTLIGLVTLLNLGLKTYVFTKADNYCYERSVPMMAKDQNGEELTKEEIAKQEADNLRICEEQRASNRQGQASTAIALLIVGLPLYFYHWNTIRKDKEV